MPSNYVITTVVEAADTFDLATLLDVKTDCNISDGDPAVDIFLKRQIKGASAAIANYCNRIFALQTYQDVVRRNQSGFSEGYMNRADGYQVANLPLVSVVEVTDSDGNVLVENTDFEVNLASGTIYKLSTNGNPITWPACKMTVKYTAGWSMPYDDDGDNPLPSDVEDACIRLVKGRYLGKDRDPMLKTDEVAGVGAQTFWIPNTPTGNFPPDVQDLLDNYRFPVTA